MKIKYKFKVFVKYQVHIQRPTLSAAERISLSQKQTTQEARFRVVESDDIANWIVLKFHTRFVLSFNVQTEIRSWQHTCFISFNKTYRGTTWKRGVNW